MNGARDQAEVTLSHEFHPTSSHRVPFGFRRSHCPVDSAAIAAPSHAAVDFVKDVQPILEMNCVSCHAGEKAEGGFDLSNREAAFKFGSDSHAIVPFKPDESLLYKLTIVPKDDDTLMPPAKKGGPLDKKSIETLRLWISQGANWPSGITLKTRAKKSTGTPNSDDMELVRRIHAQIVERGRPIPNSPITRQRFPRPAHPTAWSRSRAANSRWAAPSRRKAAIPTKVRNRA